MRDEQITMAHLEQMRDAIPKRAEAFEALAEKRQKGTNHADAN